MGSKTIKKLKKINKNIDINRDKKNFFNDYLFLVQINKFYKNNQKYIFSFFLILFIFIFFIIGKHYYKYYYEQEVFQSIKSKEFSKLKRYSPDLYELYSASLYDNTKHYISNNLIIKYKKIMNSENLNDINNYLNNKNNLFLDVVSIKYAKLLFDNGKYDMAENALKNIKNDSEFIDFSNIFKKSILIKKQLLKVNHD